MEAYIAQRYVHGKRIWRQVTVDDQRFPVNIITLPFAQMKLERERERERAKRVGLSLFSQVQ